MRKIQLVAMFVNKKVVSLALDSGCEGDVVTQAECNRLNIPVTPLDASDTLVPTQADGKSPLKIVGKVKFECNRDKVVFIFEGYVAVNLQSPILCGAAFLERNHIVQELHKRRIVVDSKYYIEETSPFCPNPNPVVEVSNISWSAPTIALSKVEFALAGAAVDIQMDPVYLPDQDYIIAPSTDALLDMWHPQVVSAKQGKISMSNTSSVPGYLNKNEPLLDIIPVSSMNHFIPNSKSSPNPIPKVHDVEEISKIVVEPSIDKNIKEQLTAIHKKHEKVFDDNLQDGYNGWAGNFEVDFNFLNNIPPSISYGCVPSYNKPADDDLLQAMIDRLEANNIVAKANDLNIIPKFASPCMLVKKNSVRQLAPGEYEKLPIQQKIRYNRFVLCMNKLNDHVQKIPAKYNKLEDTIRLVGSFEYIITTDLTDSFWQRHITESKLPYFAFHSPFRGTYLFLRSTQGFLNQSEGLEEMLSCVLQDCVAQGWCRVHADNLYVMAHSAAEAVEHWKQVLDLLLKCNLKLSAKKTFCFPATLDLLGWSKQGKFLVPDVHRQNVLITAELPLTVKDLRSFLGTYRTFYRCKEGISFILSDLEELVSGKPSSQKVEWTEVLEKKFENAKTEAKKLDKIYLPKPTDQLVLTSDYSKKGICATLWAIVDGEFLVVARMSTKLDKAQENLLPCEGEAAAQFVAGKCPFINTYILASQLKTISLLDNKPTVQASNLLKQGKFSSSKLINQVLTAISELNMDFQHISGKMGQNFVDDFGSRNPSRCSDPDKCNICNFVRDCAELTIGPISFSVSQSAVVGQITMSQISTSLVNEIITGSKPIPFNNRQAMKYLQDQDAVLLRVRELLVAGEGPHPKEKLPVRRYLNKNFGVTLARDGCLVVNKQGRQFVNRQLIVIPENLSSGLLYGLHWNLNHPSTFQLMKAVDTKFFLLDREKKIKDINESCSLCQSVKNIPEEIHNFKPNQTPDHPGKAFTVDILRTCGKKIMVTVDNFSGFIITDFAPSEKHQDLLDGLIKTITPFKSSLLTSIRVDQAPGFKALFKKKVDLKEAGIDLDLGEVKNKNATAVVDKKMQELELEIKKCSPGHNQLNIKVLAKATAVVNEKVRNQGLSAKEIIFSRDQLSNENLYLEDSRIVETIMENRDLNNKYSSKSKAKVQKEASHAQAREGHLVFLKHDGEKLRRRDLYLVIATDNTEDTVTICKVLDSFSGKPASIHPQTHNYKVKQTDIYLAPDQPEIVDVVGVHAEVLPASWSYPVTNRQKPEIPFHNSSDSAVKGEVDEDDDLWVFEAVPEPDLDDIDEDESLGNSDQQSDSPTYTADSDITIEEDYEAIQMPIHPGLLPDEQLDDDEEDRIDEDQAADREDEMAVAGDALAPPDIIAHDDELGDLWDITLNPDILPIPGQRIVFYDKVTRLKLEARVTLMFKSVQKKHPGWRNILVDDAPHQSSINLDINDLGCVRWMYRAEQHPAIPQLEGNYTLSSGATLDDRNNPSNINHPPSGSDQFVNDLNLEIPPSNLLQRGRVYQLPDWGSGEYENIVVRAHQGQAHHREAFHPQERSRRIPKLVKQLNPFRKK